MAKLQKSVSTKLDYDLVGRLMERAGKQNITVSKYIKLLIEADINSAKINRFGYIYKGSGKPPEGMEDLYGYVKKNFDMFIRLYNAPGGGGYDLSYIMEVIENMNKGLDDYK